MTGITRIALPDGTDELVAFAEQWRHSSWVKQRELEWRAGVGPEYKKPQIVFYSNDYATFDDAGQIILNYGVRLRDIISQMYHTQMMLAAANLWYYMSPQDNQLRYSQMWHRDPLVGNKLPVKAFLWCHQIDQQHGPFQYAINSRPGEKYWPEDNVLNHYPDQQQVEAMLAPDDIVTCTTGGVELHIAETIGLHRGGNVQPGYSRLCGSWAFYEAQ
ncbi:MAG: hypothetical protein KTR20_00240 [Cellvibrionaceae bacterium]|nr:hypothetical protein [Cellvibrionaceae bacterium]